MLNTPFSIKRINDTFQLKHFDCEDADLNEFLQSDSIHYQKKLLAVTYLVLSDELKIIGFFSLANDSLKDNDFEKWNSLNRKVTNRKRRKDYPAVKLVRLGVDKGQKGKGLGKEIVFFIKNWFVSENKTGCRFLLVDAYNKPETLNFYLKNEFSFLTIKDENKKTRLMYFDLIRLIP